MFWARTLAFPWKRIKTVSSGPSFGTFSRVFLGQPSLGHVPLSLISCSVSVFALTNQAPILSSDEPSGYQQNIRLWFFNSLCCIYVKLITNSGMLIFSYIPSCRSFVFELTHIFLDELNLPSHRSRCSPQKLEFVGEFQVGYKHKTSSLFSCFSLTSKAQHKILRTDIIKGR